MGRKQQQSRPLSAAESTGCPPTSCRGRPCPGCPRGPVVAGAGSCAGGSTRARSGSSTCSDPCRAGSGCSCLEAGANRVGIAAPQPPRLHHAGPRCGRSLVRGRHRLARVLAGSPVELINLISVVQKIRNPNTENRNSKESRKPGRNKSKNNACQRFERPLRYLHLPAFLVSLEFGIWNC